MFPPVRADENSEISPCKIGECETCERFTPEESAAARWAHELRTLDPAIIEKRAEAVALNTDIPSAETECGDIPTERIRCRAGAAAFWITYNGQLRPCGMMREPSASLKERGFSGQCAKTSWFRQNAPLAVFAISVKLVPPFVLPKTGDSMQNRPLCAKKWTHIHGLQQNITKEDNYGGSLCK